MQIKQALVSLVDRDWSRFITSFRVLRRVVPSGTDQQAKQQSFFKLTKVANTYIKLLVSILRSNLLKRITLILYFPSFYAIACFVAQICCLLLSGIWNIVVMSKHEHWPPFIVRCLNSNCAFNISWILTMEGDSEDSECSCYEFTPSVGTECGLLMPF
jgi:hypothetical protein